jgi:hypothetical protein
MTAFRTEILPSTVAFSVLPGMEQKRLVGYQKLPRARENPVGQVLTTTNQIFWEDCMTLLLSVGDKDQWAFNFQDL